MTWKFA